MKDYIIDLLYDYNVEITEAPKFLYDRFEDYTCINGQYFDDARVKDGKLEVTIANKLTVTAASWSEVDGGSPESWDLDDLETFTLEPEDWDYLEE